MEQLLNEMQVSEILNVSPVALRKQRCLGETPGGMPMLPYLKLGGRVRYKASVVEEYINSLGSPAA